MKKVFIYLSIVLMGVLICSQNVYADDVTGDATLNEQGHVTLGRVILQDTSGWYYDLTLENSSGLYLVKWSDVLYSVYTVDEMYFNVSGWFYKDANNKNVFDARGWTNGYTLYELMPGSFISTNIPIFMGGDTEAIEAYVNDGDKSSAENATEWRDEFSDEIPLPHNLKVLKGVNQLASSGEMVTGYPSYFNKDVVVSWEQADVIDDLQYEMEVMFYYMKFNSDGGGLKEYNSAFYPLKSATNYNNATSMTETFSASSLNNIYDIGADKLLSKMVVRVRNKCSGQTSNFVSITIDFKKQSASANEDAYTEDTDVDGEYTDTDINADSSTDGGSGGSDVSLSGVMSFIRDGFGLLGNGGIIALLSSTFVYLPNSIWVMLKFLVAMMIAVCIIKLVKDVVT